MTLIWEWILSSIIFSVSQSASGKVFLLCTLYVLFMISMTLASLLQLLELVGPINDDILLFRSAILP